MNSPRTPRIATLVLGLALLGAGAPTAAAVPQDPAPAKPPEKVKTPEELKAEEIKAFLKQYEEQLSKMTDEDAIAGIEKMKTWYLDPKLEDAEKKAIMAVFQGKVIKQRREAYLEAACKALGEMGDKSVDLLKYLVKFSLDQKTVMASVARAGLTSLGKLASPKPGDVKFLTDLLKDKDEFVGDVARAIGGYAKAPGAIRRDLFEELLKRSEGTFSKSEANDNNAKRSWNIWGTEIVDSMKKLTKQNFEKPPEFRKWLNNKDEGGGKNPRTWADPADAGGGGH